MLEDAQPAGSSIILTPRSDHRVEFYNSEEALQCSVGDYLRTGLVRGEALVIVATPEHRASFVEHLRDGHFDVDRACATGRLVLLDARETLDGAMRDGALDPARLESRIAEVLERSARAGLDGRVRVYGEMVNLLARDGNVSSALHLEELWNELRERYPFSLLCTYHVESLPRGDDDLTLRRIQAKHGQVSHSIPTEKHFRLLVESVKDYAIFMLDPEGGIISWNPGAERLKGYRADEVVGRHFSIFYPRDDVRAGTCERELEQATADGRFEDEGWRVRRDGSLFWANVIITAVYDGDGRHVGFSKVTRDLTERKRAEEQLVIEQVARARETMAREKAEQATRFSEMFVAMLGHDLRNPLNAIITAAELVKRVTQDERGVRSADRILSSSGRMARMIEQLLDFTRLRLGTGLAIERAPMDLGELATQLVEETCAAHGCSVQRELYGDTSGAWDGDRLAQVLSNLLSNAAQHGTAGRPITLRVDGSGPDHLVLEIHNEGAIAAEVLPEIFEPFRGGERRAGSRGLGLGLFITREVVQAHGGSIDAVSTPETGTTMRVRLPRAPAARR